jgi:hypothetical protein
MITLTTPPTIAILVLLPLLAMGGRQQGMGPGPGMPASAGGGSCPFTDSFSGSGALSSSWATVSSLTSTGWSLIQSSGVVELSPVSSSYASAADIVSGSSCSFPLDQYAQITVPTFTSSSYMEVMVLMTSSGSGYVAYGVVGGTGGLYSYTAGAGTVLSASCGTLSAGGTLKLAVTGSGGSQTETVYINGVSQCSYTDSTHTAGYPGVRMVSGANSTTAMRGASFIAD